MGTTSLFTTTYLGSFAGLVAATYLLVQFFKDPIKAHLSAWWVRLLAVFVAFVIQGFVLYVNGHFVVETVGLALLNSFLIAITAAGTHELSTSTVGSVVPPSVTSQVVPPAVIAPQVPDVSPPIATPQPVTNSTTETTATAQV